MCAEVSAQMEPIELQCNRTLKAEYGAVGAGQCPRFIPETMLHLACGACSGAHTHLCEQLRLHPVMKMN